MPATLGLWLVACAIFGGICMLAEIRFQDQDREYDKLQDIRQDHVVDLAAERQRLRKR